MQRNIDIQTRMDGLSLSKTLMKKNRKNEDLMFCQHRRFKDVFLNLEQMIANEKA